MPNANNIGGVLGAVNYVQNQMALGKQQGEERLTRRLSDQTIGGDPNAYRQLAAMDPKAAGAAQDAGDNQLRRMKGLIDFMEKADASGHPDYAQQAWQQYGVPYVRQFAQGTEPTANWSEAKPMVAQLKAKLAMAEAGNAATGASVQSSFIGQDGQRYAVMRDGTIKPLGVQADASVQLVEGPGGWYSVDRRTGTATPVSVGPNGQPAPTTPAPAPGGVSLENVPYVFDEDMKDAPPQVQSAIVANERAAGNAPQGGALPMPQSAPVAAQAPAQAAPVALPPPLDMVNGGQLGSKPKEVDPFAAAREQRADAADARDAERLRIAQEADKRAQAAQAVTGKRPTEDQNKSAGYALRMEQALREVEAASANDPGANRPGLGIAALDILPDALGNYAKSDNRQRVEAAQLDALDAALTLNTGAAYTKEQLRGLSKSYFPQPGDSQATVDAKKARLENLIQTARLRARDAMPGTDAAGGQGGGGGSGTPQAGTIEDGYRFKGGDPSNPANWEQI